MKRLSVSHLRYIVASIVILFIAQEVIIHRYISEPYPSLRMPPFTGTNMNSEGRYETTGVIIKVEFTNKDTLILSPKEFLYDAPDSHHWALINKFKPADNTSPAASFQEHSYAKTILPGYVISRSRSHYDIQSDPKTFRWLRKQISGIVPHKQPEKISFYWTQNVHDPNNLLSVTQEPKDTTTIMF